MVDAFAGIEIDIGKMTPIGRFSPIVSREINGVKYLYVSGTAAVNQAPYDTARQTIITFATIDKLLRTYGASI